jgi:signal transduction histidine kinase
MTKPKLFQNEASVLETAERVLSEARFADNPMRSDYSDLVAAYRKLHKHSVRVVRMSDRWQRELRELNELKNTFLGIAAHDLRNPAGAIRSLSWLLLEGGLDEGTQTGFLQDIYCASDEMLKLLDDLLNVSLIESGKLKLKLKRTNLKELVESRIRVMSMIAQSKGIDIAVELDDVPPWTVDPGRLRQVVDNLISNAVKFSPGDTTVRVRLECNGFSANISVRDQGPGIPPEERDKLFGMFHKASVKPTAGETSTGLGLAIAKKVVEAHGGKIALESAVGSGSTFTVSLPSELPEMR